MYVCLSMFAAAFRLVLLYALTTDDILWLAAVLDALISLHGGSAGWRRLLVPRSLRTHALATASFRSGLSELDKQVHIKRTHAIITSHCDRLYARGSPYAERANNTQFSYGCQSMMWRELTLCGVIVVHHPIREECAAFIVSVLRVYVWQSVSRNCKMYR